MNFVTPHNLCTRNYNPCHFAVRRSSILGSICYRGSKSYTRSKGVCQENTVLCFYGRNLTTWLPRDIRKLGLMIYIKKINTCLGILHYKTELRVLLAFFQLQNYWKTTPRSGFLGMVPTLSPHPLKMSVKAVISLDGPTGLCDGWGKGGLIKITGRTKWSWRASVTQKQMTNSSKSAIGDARTCFNLKPPMPHLSPKSWGGHHFQDAREVKIEKLDGRRCCEIIMAYRHP